MNNEELYNAIVGRLDSMDSRFDRIETRLDAVDSRFDKIEARLDAVDSRLDTMDSRLDAMDSRLDAMDSRLDTMDSRLDTMDSKIESLQNDVREIKVVQLENRILPVLGDIITYQKDTYDRYIKEANTIQTLQADMDTVKQTIIIHSEKFKKLGV